MSGNKLVNGANQTVQLRGVNVMGFEYSAVQQFGSTYPQLVNNDWAVMKNWGVNAVRIPINESSWLGGNCVTADWTTGSPGYKLISADPYGDYRAVLKATVDRATAEGMYVILDLHLANPNDPSNAINGVTRQCAIQQNVMADASNSITFWSQIATIYKTYPNVLFELFNEPYMTQWSTLTMTDAQASAALRDGTTVSGYAVSWQGPETNISTHTWQSAGFQAMLTAVRDAGATNVVLVSAINYAGKLQNWYTYRPTDPAGQLAAAWHAYPAYGTTWGTDAYKLPNYGESAYSWAQGILSNNIPVVVTEYGDKSSNGTVGSPYASTLLPRLDTMGISYFGWTFTVSGEPSNALIKDHNGTPTDGYGQYVKQHYQCRAAGTQVCP